jgi:hypothetical protein
MQLISIAIISLSALLFLSALCFVVTLHKARQNENITSCLNNTIFHYGITLVSAYPTTLRPLLSMIEERYPRSEAMLICDLQRDIKRIGDVVHRFSLVRVNHDHIDGVRALYRSRCRAYRRIVVIDLPLEMREQSESVARKVASYGYILYTEGDICVEPNAATIGMNIAATYPISTPLSLDSTIGERVVITMVDTDKVQHIAIAQPFVWRERCNFKYLIIASILPLLILFMSGRFWLYSIALYLTTIIVLLYAACRTTSQKSLIVRFDTITHNFCRFIVDNIKRFYYLYKRLRYTTFTRHRAVWRPLQQKTESNNRVQL